ncbi:hypothetical protein RUR49_01920 [Pseudoxanthobacter sp. M-2]|uniref:hypothetical protein n=1 Tax=Pseudoxanthobacter sp. M-2 TaxID=3078754 RepID=UPI0038FCAAD6
MSGLEGLGSPPWRVVGSAERKPRMLGVIDVPVVVVGMSTADGVIDGGEAPVLPGMAIGNGTIMCRRFPHGGSGEPLVRRSRRRSEFGRPRSGDRQR